MIPSASQHKDKRTSQTIASDRSRLRATLRAIVKSSHPALHAIVAALEDVAPAFEREFGVAPRLRAALHAGPVISGEIGESKRDIVFHGDVMNTAARLEQATRDLDRRFLVSSDALSRLAATERYAAQARGPRSKAAKATITPKADTHWTAKRRTVSPRK